MAIADILFGNNLELLTHIEDNSVDAIVTDPPYGLKFMGKKWDYEVPTVAQWKECLRVLKPGGYLLSFAGTRTQHRMACNIEDAGFEIRDMIAWVYGSGFPKSLNIGKAIDNKFGVDRKVTGKRKHPTLKNTNLIEEQANASHGSNSWSREWDVTEPATSEAEEWEGWGSALKPALEPITMARKPISEKTIAENILKWGTGGINIDECRVETEIVRPLIISKNGDSKTAYGNGLNNSYQDTNGTLQGRFPANLIHDGSDEVIDTFPKSNGAAAPVKRGQNGDSKGIYGDFAQKGDDGETFRNDSGSAARFFYCAKASRSERNLGCEEMETEFDSSRPWCNEESDRDRIATRLVSKQGKNNHPTVKPIKLMEYLVKLVSKEGAIILDPWGGSGTTGIACVNLKRQFILMEEDKHSYDIMRARISHFIPEVNINASQKKELKFGDQMSLF